jgi:hypothetical protein
MLTIPQVARTRETLPFEPTYNDSKTHEPGIDKFCRTCGADLRIDRLRVDHEYDVPQSAKTLLAIAVTAELDGALPNDRLLADVTLEQKRELAALYCEGLEPVVVSSMCGLAGVDLVGIGPSGTFFYAAK